MKKNIQDFENKLASRLMSAIVAQITRSIRISLNQVSNTYLLFIFMPLYLLLHNTGVMSIIPDIIHSLAIDTSFSLVRNKDVGLTIVNLFGVFLLGTSFEEGNISTTAQYMLAMQVSDLVMMNKDSLIEMVVIILMYMNIGLLHESPRLYDTCSLVVLNLTQQWFLAQVPLEAQLPCIILLLYTILPFLQYYNKAADAYNFMIMTATLSLNINGVSYWIQTVIFAIVWLGKNDQVSETLGQLATLRLAQLAFINSLSSMARTDPFFVYSIILICFQFIRPG